MIFAWDGASGRNPRWDRPLEEPEQDGWSGLSFYRTRLRGHPQATTEKTIYLLHLSYVHGSTEVKQLRPVELSVQVMRTDLELTPRSQEASGRQLRLRPRCKHGQRAHSYLR